MKIREVLQRGPSAERNALRRSAPPPGAGEPDLAALHDLAEEIGGVPARLQITDLTPGGEDDGPEVEVVVDPEAVSRAEVTIGALEKETAVPAEVRAPAERLGRNVASHAAIVGCQSAADQLAEDLGDTERWAAQGEGQLQAEFFRVLDGHLDGTLGKLSPAERDRLRAAAAPILRLRAETASGPIAEAGKTRDAHAEAAAIVEEAAREAHMVETALDLKDERPVSAADLAAAIDTFHALGTGETQ